MRSGVGAVVAAGWAVHDTAARDFARVFYERMLDGQTLGEAVRAARLEVFHQYRGNNTWAAYQCYGDPDFQFLTAVRPRWTSSAILSSQHLIKELQVLEKKAGDAVTSEHVTGVVRSDQVLGVQCPTVQGGRRRDVAGPGEGVRRGR